jgi:antitoxin component of RelBE/YafQ-DinJ toxin-antitoxin module
MEDRLDIRIDSVLVSRIKESASKLGISLSGYVRMAIIEKLRRDELLHDTPVSHIIKSYEIKEQ